ncbi:putative Heterokaryon incompatibility domain-containing protein [Seiridium unicorne]|uniref:Heterokaryon incompatibility domain-containing protein n=1 Tax=Seiridium unicorne TaxID=138068 RepID=A0ABR2UQ50_9PEZI
MPIRTDSVCINKNGYDERRTQVEIMDKIYGKAERVIIGPRGSYGNDDTFMPLFKDNELLHCLRGHLKHQAPYTLHSEECPRTEMVAMSQAAFLPTINFQAWWSRARIVQEVVLAVDDPLVLVGNYAINWSRLMEMLHLLRTWNTAKPDTLCKPQTLSSIVRQHTYTECIPSETPIATKISVLLAKP